MNAKLIKMRSTKLNQYREELYCEKSGHLLRWQVGEPWQGLGWILTQVGRQMAHNCGYVYAKQAGTHLA
jgi:hypothetical protein